MVLCALGGYFVWNAAGRHAARPRPGRAARPHARPISPAGGPHAGPRGGRQCQGRGSPGHRRVDRRWPWPLSSCCPAWSWRGSPCGRGGMSYRQAVSFSLNPLILPQALLPGYWQNPFSEYVGYVGVVGLLLAILGAAASWRNPRTGFFVALAGVGTAPGAGRLHAGLHLWLRPGSRLRTLSRARAMALPLHLRHGRAGRVGHAATGPAPAAGTARSGRQRARRRPRRRRRLRAGRDLLGPPRRRSDRCRRCFVGSGSRSGQPTRCTWRPSWCGSPSAPPLPG